MASRNALKVDIAEQCYHAYNRGVNKCSIFKDEQDYHAFLNLLKRYLDDKPQLYRRKVSFPTLKGKIELLTYCLMPNHFHLLFYQVDEGSMKKLMQNVCASYTAYFNKKYSRVGHLFQGVYKASLISSDSYIQHISRYIHLNPKEYKAWPYSSLQYYIGTNKAEWIKPERVLTFFENDVDDYVQFIEDYESQKELMDDLKHELADGAEKY